MTSNKPTGSTETVWRALATATAAMVEPYDVVGVLTRLLAAGAEATGASSAGLVITSAGDRLQLLAATSHRAEELEIYQLQRHEGPCVEAARTGSSVQAVSSDQVARLWPSMIAPFERAGFASVLATPLRWHSATIGALNLFWSQEHEDTAGLHAISQAFADVATVAIVHSGRVSPDVVQSRIQLALDERTVIEQAKGVLAHQRHLSVDAAFAVLLQLAEESGELLSAAALAVVQAASKPSPG